MILRESSCVVLRRQGDVEAGVLGHRFRPRIGVGVRMLKAKWYEAHVELHLRM